MKEEKEKKKTYKDVLTFKDIESLFTYNPVEGKLFKRKDGSEINFDFQTQYEDGPRLEFRVRGQDEKLKKFVVPARSVAWMLYYQSWNKDLIIHRDLNNRNLKISNLISMTVSEYRQMLSMLKNFESNCRVRRHKTNQYKFVVRYTESSKIYNKTFVDFQIADKYAKQLKASFMFKLRKVGMILDL